MEKICCDWSMEDCVPSILHQINKSALSDWFNGIITMHLMLPEHKKICTSLAWLCAHLEKKQHLDEKCQWKGKINQKQNLIGRPSLASGDLRNLLSWLVAAISDTWNKQHPYTIITEQVIHGYQKIQNQLKPMATMCNYNVWWGCQLKTSQISYTLSCWIACCSLGDLCNRCLVSWSWSPAIAEKECLPTVAESNMWIAPASSASSTSASAHVLNTFQSTHYSILYLLTLD